MKAIAIQRFGGPEVLEVAELEIPEPAAGQVLIRVQAAAVNPVDVATRAGWLADHGLMRANGQIGIGWDLAGTIEALGSGTARSTSSDSTMASGCWSQEPPAPSEATRSSSPRCAG